MKSNTRIIKRRLPLVWKEMQEQGWEVDRMAGTGHLFIRHPSGHRITVSLSASCSRNDKNTRMRMRKVESQQIVVGGCMLHQPTPSNGDNQR